MKLTTYGIAISVSLLFSCKAQVEEKVFEIDRMFENRFLSISNFTEKTYIRDSHLVDNNDLIVDAELHNLLSDFYSDVSVENPAKIYVPKNPEDEKKVTKILGWKESSGKWKFGILSSEHEKSEGRELVKRLEDYFNSEADIQLDYVFLPVSYYDKSQRMELP